MLLLSYLNNICHSISVNQCNLKRNSTSVDLILIANIFKPHTIICNRNQNKEANSGRLIETSGLVNVPLRIMQHYRAKAVVGCRYRFQLQQINDFLYFGIWYRLMRKHGHRQQGPSPLNSTEQRTIIISRHGDVLDDRTRRSSGSRGHFSSRDVVKRCFFVWFYSDRFTMMFYVVQRCWRFFKK